MAGRRALPASCRARERASDGSARGEAAKCTFAPCGVHACTIALSTWRHEPRAQNPG
eukprot:CAMPEP_0181508190 /NCGR_PEP_ID=MMETSP1110-20121109/59588_1 /TAXON_ID=174948 /ORGANISM="Symbiodinium sp., Strain CCMP421" /LENGTH=56 /DNA_ID=CAMNT_0023637483 /DNA_START=29 /DNA_END=195 /DNA_ORIENTATION=+